MADLSKTPTPRNRVCVIGEFACGKTSLVTRFVGKPFSFHGFNPVGSASHTVIFPTDNPDDSPVCVCVTDTSGQERFRLSVTNCFVRIADIVLVCFDLTSQQSFDLAQNRWLTWSLDSTRCEAKHIIVGMKCDMKAKRAVSFEEASKWAEQNNLEYFETSSFTDDGIESLMKRIGSHVKHQRMPPKASSEFGSTISLVSNHDRAEENTKFKRCKACFSS